MVNTHILKLHLLLMEELLRKVGLYAFHNKSLANKRFKKSGVYFDTFKNGRILPPRGTIIISSKYRVNNFLSLS